MLWTQNLVVFNAIETYNQMNGSLIYLAKAIMHSVEKSTRNLILWGLQNIVEKDIYRIKVELRSRRVVISLKLDDIFVSLKKFALHGTPNIILDSCIARQQTKQKGKKA